MGKLPVMTPELHELDPTKYQLLLYHKIAIDQNIRALNEAMQLLGISQGAVDVLNPIFVDMGNNLNAIRKYISDIMADVSLAGKDIIAFGESVHEDLCDAMKLLDEAKKIANV